MAAYHVQINEIRFYCIVMWIISLVLISFWFDLLNIFHMLFTHNYLIDFIVIRNYLFYKFIEKS
jgi:hypothetical protein